MVTLREIEYGGWSHCYELSNDKIDLVITGDVGPRIIRFGFKGQSNLFCEVPEMMGKTGGDEWRIYGGHRFWHAPEERPRTYYPDNSPVQVAQQKGFIRVTSPLEETTHLQKQIDIQIPEDKAHVHLTHRLINHNLWSIEVAPWALSVMAGGGTAVLPHPPRGTHPENLLPANTLTLWPYTDMSDARWKWGEHFILLRQEAGNPKPQKVGMMILDQWVAYVLSPFCFVKQFDYQPGAIYPDLGCSAEVFTNDFMLELETLGPLTQLAPGERVEHVENWHLFTDVATPGDDNTVEKYILPYIRGL